MKRKILVLVVVALIVVFTYLYLRPTPSVLSIDKVYNAPSVGSTVLVNVTISNIPSCGGYDLVIVWNPNILKLTTGGPNSTQPYDMGPPVQLIEGPFLKDFGKTQLIVFTVDNLDGFVEFGNKFTGASETASGTGVLATLNFTIAKAGTTSIELRPPTPYFNESLVIDSSGLEVYHDELNGLVTSDAPPPFWTTADFQNTAITGEVLLLGAASIIIYWRVHPKPTKAERRKAELQPVIEPADQV